MSFSNTDLKYKKALFDIYNNRMASTFQQLGYRVVNLSPFNFKNYPAAYQNRFLPINEALLLAPTVIDDLYGNFPVYFAKSINDIQMLQSHYQKRAQINFRLIDSTLLLSMNLYDKPCFIYLHLLMPHAPYIFDSTGNVNVKFLSKKNISLTDKKVAYLENLKYTNLPMIDFVQKLKRNSNDKAIIVLMSDHGCKDFGPETRKYNALNAIFLPQKNYSKWYKGMSYVNQVRNIFSVITGYDIALLHDSIAN